MRTTVHACVVFPIVSVATVRRQKARLKDGIRTPIFALVSVRRAVANPCRFFVSSGLRYAGNVIFRVCQGKQNVMEYGGEVLVGKVICSCLGRPRPGSALAICRWQVRKITTRSIQAVQVITCVTRCAITKDECGVGATSINTRVRATNSVSQGQDRVASVHRKLGAIHLEGRDPRTAAKHARVCNIADRVGANGIQYLWNTQARFFRRTIKGIRPTGLVKEGRPSVSIPVKRSVLGVIFQERSVVVCRRLFNAITANCPWARLHDSGPAFVVVNRDRGLYLCPIKRRASGSHI